MKRSSFLIASLTASALVLTVLTVVLTPTPRTVLAENATLGDYTLIAKSNAVGGDDYITIIDNREGKMLTYQVNNIQGPTGRLELVGTYDLMGRPAGR